MMEHNPLFIAQTIPTNTDFDRKKKRAETDMEILDACGTCKDCDVQREAIEKAYAETH